MTTKKTLIGADDIRISVSKLRGLLSNSSGMTTKIRFKRYGQRFIITNKDNNIDDKLQSSFNTFMNKLQTDDGELKGICFLGNTSDEFKVLYQKKQDNIMHQIKGKLV